MVRLGQAAPDSVGLILAECAEHAAPRPTLLWGRDVARPARALVTRTPVRAIAPTIEAASSLAVPHEIAWHPAPGPEERFIIRLPRAKDELAWRLAVVAARLPLGGEVWVAGRGREGIRAAAAPLAEAIGPVTIARIKHHARVLSATRLAGPPAAAPDADRSTTRFEIPWRARRLACATVAGTFSAGRLDDGTARLLAALDELPDYHAALDLGSGSGVLGAALALARPGARVDLVDSAAAAVASSRLTLAANGLDPGRARLACVADAPPGPYDLVVTNPPFHREQREDRSLAAGFADAAARRLAPGGALLLVANRHLGYADILGARFAGLSVALEDNRYRVWRCARPRVMAREGA